MLPAQVNDGKRAAFPVALRNEPFNARLSNLERLASASQILLGVVR